MPRQKKVAARRQSARRRGPPARFREDEASTSAPEDSASVPEQASSTASTSQVSSVAAEVIRQLQESGVLEKVAKPKAKKKRGAAKQQTKPPPSSSSSSSSSSSEEDEESPNQSQAKRRCYSDDNSDYEVDRLASETVADLMAGKAENRGSGLTFTPASCPLGAAVNAKLKAKIWSDQYVDLAQLLPSDKEDTYTVTVSKQGGRPNFAVSPAGRPKSIANIDQWTDAFAIYAAIRVERSPNEAGGLLKYLSTVRQLSRKCDPKWWAYYDTQFRHHREAVGSLSWGDIHWELYLHVTTQPRTFRPFGNGSGNSPRTSHKLPQGQCWGFHRSGKCTTGSSCQFSHSCFLCKESHPVFRCKLPAAAKYRSSGSGKGSNQSQPSTSNSNK